MFSQNVKLFLSIDFALTEHTCIWVKLFSVLWCVHLSVFMSLFQDCGLQLNDEEGHRCYPLEGHLLCHSCHIHRLQSQVPAHLPPSYPLHVTEL